jgi:hypothetical protein
VYAIHFPSGLISAFPQDFVLNASSGENTSAVSGNTIIKLTTRKKHVDFTLILSFEIIILSSLLSIYND